MKAHCCEKTTFERYLHLASGQCQTTHCQSDNQVPREIQHLCAVPSSIQPGLGACGLLVVPLLEKEAAKTPTDSTQLHRFNTHAKQR